MLLNAFDFPSGQAALNAAALGDRVYLPGLSPNKSPDFYQAPVGGWEIERTMEIFGDGPGKDGSYAGTVLTPNASSASDRHVFVIAPESSRLERVYIHDLRITKRQGQSGTDGADAVRFAPLVTEPGKKLSDLRLERLSISYLGGAGIRLEGKDDDPRAIVGVQIVDCDVAGCGAEGVRLAFAYQAMVTRCRLAGNGAAGIKATNNSQPVLFCCSFEGNRLQGGVAELEVDGCGLASIDACRFGEFVAGANPRAIYLNNCGGVGSVSACVFQLSTLNASAVGIEAGVLSNGALLFMPCRFTNVGTVIKIPNEVRDCVVLPQFAEPGTAVIGLPTGTLDAPTALPSINRGTSNTEAGLLPPVLLNTQAVQGPQGGMMVFTGGELRLYTDGEWRKVQVL